MERQQEAESEGLKEDHFLMTTPLKYAVSQMGKCQGKIWKGAFIMQVMYARKGD